MRAITLLALLLALGLGGVLASPAPAAAPAPVAVGVAAREFSLSLYRPTVRPGTVRFNLTNFGEDVHDMAVVAPGGRRVGHMAEVKSAGGRGRLEVRLARKGT